MTLLTTLFAWINNDKKQTADNISFRWWWRWWWLSWRIHLLILCPLWGRIY